MLPDIIDPQSHRRQNQKLLTWKQLKISCSHDKPDKPSRKYCTMLCFFGFFSALTYHLRSKWKREISRKMKAGRRCGQAGGPASSLMSQLRTKWKVYELTFVLNSERSDCLCSWAQTITPCWKCFPQDFSYVSDVFCRVTFILTGTLDFYQKPNWLRASQWCAWTELWADNTRRVSIGAAASQLVPPPLGRTTCRDKRAGHGFAPAISLSYRSAAKAPVRADPQVQRSADNLH